MIKNRNPSIKQTINFTEVNGTGSIRLQNGKTRDVFVYGYFKMFHWWFIVHQDIDYPDYVTVSEASTGQLLIPCCYENAEMALSYAVAMIENKRYHFATAVGDQLVRFKCNLLRRNSSPLTLAISSLWI